MRLCKLALVIGAAALMASPVLAQQPGRGRGMGGFGGPGMYLRIEKVQKDLGLDKDGVKKAEDALTKVNEDTREDRQKAFNPDTSQEERTKLMAKINEAQDKALKDVLSEKQMKRLKQIERQQALSNVFSMEDVQKALKLADDQKTKIKEINDDMNKEVREAFQGGFSPETMTKIQGLRKDAMSNAMKVLKDDQKKELKELLGEPLELTQEDLMQGRGGRGRGGKPGADKPRTDF
jgi:hypothetical protein